MQCIVCVFVGSCLATQIFIGNLPATGSGSSLSRLVMNGGQLYTANQLYDMTLIRVHSTASRAPH